MINRAFWNDISEYWSKEGVAAVPDVGSKIIYDLDDEDDDIDDLIDDILAD